jgi:hypothetical protein
MKRSAREHEFKNMGDLFIADVGPIIFWFLKLPQMPSTYATSMAMRELTKQRTRELLEVARTLNAPPFCMHLKDTDFLGEKLGVGLENKMIDDVDMKSFSVVALGSGALAKMTGLGLTSNKIGDDGMKAFASAIASGALPNLKLLYLGRNKISDPGMVSFSDAIARGALGSLVELWLPLNRIGDEGMKAFSSAITTRALGALGSLHLSRNAIGDAGLISLAEAIRSGALPKLNFVSVWGNSGNTIVVQEACNLRKISCISSMH